MIPPDNSPIILVPCGHTFWFSFVFFHLISNFLSFTAVPPASQPFRIHTQRNTNSHVQYVEHKYVFSYPSDVFLVQIISTAPNRSLQRIMEEYAKSLSSSPKPSLPSQSLQTATTSSHPGPTEAPVPSSNGAALEIERSASLSHEHHIRLLVSRMKQNL